MMNRFAALWLCAVAIPYASAQEFRLPGGPAPDETALEQGMPDLAREVLARYHDDNPDIDLSNRYPLELLAGNFTAAAATMNALLARHPGSAEPPQDRSLATQLYVRARDLQTVKPLAVEDSLAQAFHEVFARYDDKAAVSAAGALQRPLNDFQDALHTLLMRLSGSDRISLADALELVRDVVSLQAYRSLAPVIGGLVSEDDQHRYIIQQDVLIKTQDGVTLSAIVVRSRNAREPQPAALFTTVQTDVSAELRRAKYAAARGYVGVSSDTRGKRLSPDEIVLYEDDARDLYWVIDWISKQPWNNGSVGMWGGSNSGFMQWAAAKTHHPALKTIVPYCPENPGYGLPMLNNVFINANYAVNFYLTNTKYLDDKTYNDSARWRSLAWDWYRSGRPYRQIDQIDGTPNKWLQRALQHPAYDAYWQSMTAYKDDFAQLKIPVLAIDGYYDDGQVFALLNLEEHYLADPKAEHYLLIGPYDHFGTQSSTKPTVLRGYTIDPVAQIDTPDITFQWFDYVMRGGPRPALLQDRINFEVMGANTWHHVPSLDKTHSEELRLYLTETAANGYHLLSSRKPVRSGELQQTVDFSDRTLISANIYPDTILSAKIDLSGGLNFVSDPFDAAISVNGMFSAVLKFVTNKKDLDIAMVLYEITPDGRYFHLADIIQRASYARDMTTRRLLTPGKVQTIPLRRTEFVSRQLGKGSRLLVVLDVNKGPWAQVNYGTGKDVSDESIADARTPLRLHWHNDSYVRVPISR
jgi:uncharacterized protein